MSDLMILVSSKDSTLIYDFFKDRVFLEVHKDDKNFFEMLATHSEKVVRDTCAKLLLFCISQM